MAKDPAVLFYTSDFLTETMLMTDEQVGKYIRLLCLQHQQGHLSEEDMLSICKTYDNKIFNKFTKDEMCLYYNSQLEKETVRRAKYTESRRQNLQNIKRDKSHMGSHMGKHMGKHMETATATETATTTEARTVTETGTNKKCIFSKPTKTEVMDYINQEQLKVDSDTFLDHYESNGWKVGKAPMKNWQATLRNWSRKNKEVKKPFKNEFLEKLKEMEREEAGI